MDRCCTAINSCLHINGAEEQTENDFENLDVFCGDVLNNAWAAIGSNGGNTPSTVTGKYQVFSEPLSEKSKGVGILFLLITVVLINCHYSICYSF